MKTEGTLEAAALAAEFSNEVRGAQLYGGKVYDIRGVLARVINENNDPYLMLHGASMDVSCHFEKAELSAVAQLEPKTSVTVRGVITGKTNGVVVIVQPCIVVSPGATPSN